MGYGVGPGNAASYLFIFIFVLFLGGIIYGLCWLFKCGREEQSRIERETTVTPYNRAYRTRSEAEDAADIVIEEFSGLPQPPADYPRQQRCRSSQGSSIGWAIDQAVAVTIAPENPEICSMRECDSL